MEQQDEIQSLRKELEQLRAQLEDQRAPARQLETAARPASPARPFDAASVSAKPPERADARDLSPRRSATGVYASSSGANEAGGYDTRGLAPPRRSTALAEHIDRVPVDSKRGKWWLKDRQVLSRNVAAPDAEFMAVKVREVWLWGGRTVIVDKVVTVPTENFNEHLDANSPRLASPTSSAYDRLRELGSKSMSESKRNLEVYADSKELAKEFMMQPQGEAGENANPPLTASARMAMEMERAMKTRDKSDSGEAEGRQSSLLKDSPR